MKHDNWIPMASQRAMTMLLREVNLKTMTPSRTLKIYNNRRKRIMQIVGRVSRCGFPVREVL